MNCPKISAYATTKRALATVAEAAGAVGLAAALRRQAALIERYGFCSPLARLPRLEQCKQAQHFSVLPAAFEAIGIAFEAEQRLGEQTPADRAKAHLSLILQALDPETRAEVLGPHITMASTAELCANMALDVIRERERATEAESRATVAEGKVVELENEIASRKRAARERVTAEECEPDETIARLAEMEKR